MKKYLISVTVFFAAINAFAWGQQGHSIVALVAQRALADQANAGDAQASRTLSEITNILGDTTIDQGAVWPDQIRETARTCKVSPYERNPDGTMSAICSAYAGTAGWHFINTTATEYTGPTSTQGDLVMLLTGLPHVLRGEPDGLGDVTAFQNWKTQCLSKTGHNCKKEALEFLLHFVGDIHQPLHVGAPCDLGGNDQLIVFFGQDKDPNANWCTPKSPATCGQFELHAAWDTTLLLYQSAAPMASLTGSNFSTSAYAAKLAVSESGKKQSVDGKCVTTAPDDDIALDAKNGPVTWANESICYMQQVYTFPDEPAAAAKPVAINVVTTALRSLAQAMNVVPNLCSDDRKSMDGKYASYAAFQVGQQYYNVNMPTIDERLYWAGHRLATVLKQIYGTGDKVTGDISN